MTIRHLKIFIEVATTGKMSAAAKNLFMTQPSVSQAIRELENHYHTLLFERYAKKLYITEAGRRLYSYARQAVEQFDQLEEQMAADGLHEKLRIGATISVGGSVLSPIVRELRGRYPELEVYSFVDNTQEVEKRILDMELDAGIVEGIIKSHELITVPLMKDPLVLACSREHPFAEKKILHLEDLEGQEFAIRETGSGTRELLERFLLKHHIQIQVSFEAHTFEAIKHAVRWNNCLTLISGRLLKRELESGEMVAFSNESQEWNRDFSLVCYRQKNQGEYIAALRAIASACGRENEELDSISRKLEI